MPASRLRSLPIPGLAESLQPGVFKAVSGSDVVYVGGYECLTYMAALVLGRVLQKRVVLFFDGVAPSRLHRRGPKEWLKRILVRLPHMCLVNGSVAEQYFLRDLGLSAERVRNQWLVPVRPTLERRDQPRLGVIYVGRLIDRKRVSDLLDAMRLLPDLDLTVVGDGELRAELEIRGQGLPVRWLGELDRPEIDDLIASAQCLVLPSVDEPWGLVVHEAIQLGTPVVVSDDVASGYDLVVPGGNGYVFRAKDVPDLAAKIRDALQLNLQSVDDCSMKVLSTWNLENHVDAFLDAASAQPSQHASAVLVLQVAVPGYRTDFFDALRERLPSLVLAAGDRYFDPTVATDPDRAHLDVMLRNRFVLGRRLVWMSGARRLLRSADMAVVELNTAT